MAAFVLVHGSFHGPWCWARIAPALRAAGHVVATPDLAEAVTDKPHPDLHDYAALVAQTAREVGGSAILVGHSMGGLVITQAAELLPGAVAATLYVSGLLLRHGETLQSFLRDHDDLGVDDLVVKNMEVSADRQVARFPPEAAPAVFYNRCTAAEAAWATAQLRPQPTAVYATPLSISPAKPTPRAYVMCTDDRAVSVAYQRQMLANTPCDKIYSLDADHSPFLSAVDGLVDCLRDVAA